MPAFARFSFLLLIISLVFITSTLAQDPFSTHFFNNKSLFNPAYTGGKNAVSFNLSHKSQWDSQVSRPYKTSFLTYEEAMPCQFLDYGFRLLYDEEGDGILTTLDVGAMVAGTLSGWKNTLGEHNLRIGASFAWRQHAIDFTRLTFSDQLDPKYGFVDVNGIPIPSAFIPPNDNKSSVYFNPSVGLLFRSVWNPKSKRAWMSNIGISAQNLLQLNASVLDDDEYQSWRLTMHAEVELVPAYLGQKIVTLKPLFLFQNQGNINYFEFGVQGGYDNHLLFGGYFHSNSANGIVDNTNWFTINTTINFPVHLSNNHKSLMQVGFSYSDNLNNLDNFFGPQFQLGLSINLEASPACSLFFGEPAAYTHTTPCEIWQVSAAKRKIYENIWYNSWDWK